MADFCQQCSMELFGEDFKDLANLGDGSKLEEGQGWVCICEGCGPTIVDDNGVCLSLHSEMNHGGEKHVKV